MKLTPTQDKFWLDFEKLVTRYVWSRIYRPDAYIPSSLLSMKDSRGKTPGIFIACSFDRGPGKTFAFTYKLMTDYIDSGGECKFLIIARQQAEVGYLAGGMFKPMMDMIYHGEIYETQKMHGKYSEIWWQDADGDRHNVGYVVPISASDDIKKVSGRFADAYQWYFDEFQPASDSKYLPDEPLLFRILIQSFGRGGGEHARVVPGYMASNTMSVLNDYFLAMGISNKIQPETKKYRGEGFVLQVVSIPGLAEKHETNPVLIALTGGEASIKQALKDDRWVNDNTTNVIKNPRGWGNAYYVATIALGTQRYGVMFFPDCNYWYIHYKTDKSCKSVYSVMIGDNINLQLLKTVKLFDQMKTALRGGVMFFASPVCKKAVMSFIR